MILWRVLPWRPAARPREPGGALWFPRELQGAGRHDNPDLYGCLYASESQVSPVAEVLAPFRGSGSLTEAMLVRSGMPLALARLSLADEARVVDLDDPHVLLEFNLRPSRVATGERSVSQAYAARLFGLSARPLALRWWSTLESGLANLTVFDRAQAHMDVLDVSPLATGDAAVREAAELVGLRS